MIICKCVLLSILFLGVSSISEAHSDVSEIYDAVDQIVGAPKLHDEEDIRIKILTLQDHLNSLDKYIECIYSSLDDNVSVEQKLNNICYLIEFTAFVSKFYEEKAAVGSSGLNSIVLKPADFTPRSPDYTKDYIEMWATSRYNKGYFYTTLAISNIYYNPDADLTEILQFLNEKPFPQSLRNDLLILLDGDYTRNRKWRLRKNGFCYTGCLKNIDKNSITIQLEGESNETVVVNVLDLDNNNIIFVDRLKPHFRTFAEINAFKKTNVKIDNFDSEGLRKLFLFNRLYKSFRNWESEDKIFKATAKFISLEGDNVVLEKADGKLTTIELSVLRQLDQDYIKKIRITP